MRKKVISKEQVIDEAIKLISSQGLEACSMRALASNLSVAVGTIYNYFASQDELFKELFVYSWQRTIERLEEAAGTEHDDVEKFKTYSYILLEEIENRKGLGFFVFGRLGVGKVIATSDYGLGKGLIEPLKKILKGSKKNRNLDDNQLTMTVEWVLFAFNSYFVFERKDPDAFVDLLVERFI